MRNVKSFMMIVLCLILNRAVAQTGTGPDVTKLMLGLQENAYVHLNKPYYYPKERLWYKVYMLYADYDYRDSLSRVLHVVLLSPNAQPIRHDRLTITDGTAWGDLYLPDSLVSGTYFLKVYTHWMLNYGDSTVSYIPIPILEKNSRPVYSGKPDYPCEYIQTKTQNELTHRRVKLTVANEALRNYSVSVTDTSFVHKIPALPYHPKMLTETNTESSLRVIYPMERGLQMGLTLSGKPKWVANKQLLAVRQADKTFETLTTNEKGRLIQEIVPGQPSETILFSLADQPNQAISLIADKQPEPITKLPAVPFVETRTGMGSVADFDTLESDAVRLEAVQVKGKRLPKHTALTLYGRADATVKGDDIMRAQVDNAVLALQGRVSGLQITIMNGRVVMNIRNSQKSSFSTQIVDPLVLVDGVPMAISSLNDVAAIPPQTIDHIEVVKTVQAIYGSRGGNGIIAIFTKQGTSQAGQSNSPDSQQYAIPIVCDGYAPQHTFTTNELNTDQARAVLYWQPNATATPSASSALDFWVAPKPATYHIEVVGVRTDGSILKCVKYLSVK
jgi:hypothetical protein